MRTDARHTLALLRTGVGVGALLSPGGSWRAFGLGGMQGSPSAGLVTRLFGVRELVLAAAVSHPDPALRRVGLQLSAAADTTDVVSTVLALRRGAPKTSALLVGAGAALFVALGLTALADG